jgi:hypothetical protein
MLRKDIEINWKDKIRYYYIQIKDKRVDSRENFGLKLNSGIRKSFNWTGNWKKRKRRDY